jgi:hypothetical protein
LFSPYRKFKVRAQFGVKDCCSCTLNPSAKEVGGLEVFLYEPAQDFELHLNIQDQNLKNQKSLAIDVLSEAYPMVPF